MPIRRRGALARRHPSRRVRAPQRAGGRVGSFEVLVERALDGLPPEIGRLLEGVAVVIEDWPTPEQDDLGEADDDGWLYGLYEGTPIVEYAADSVAFPNKITLFRVPLEEDFPDPRDLAEEVRRTVVHELGHHAGFDDERLRALGYD